MIKCGKYAMYKGNEYELSSDMDDNDVLITTDSNLIDETFCDIFKSGTYSKIVNIKDLDEVYEIVSYGIVDGKRVYLREESVDSYYIGTDDCNVAEELSLERTDKFMYEGWISKKDIKIVEERVNLHLS